MPRRVASLALALALALPSAAAGDAHSLGDLHSISCPPASAPGPCALQAFDGASATLVPLRLAFWGPQTVQWWLQLDGNWTDVGMAADVLVGLPAAPLPVTLTQVGSTAWEVAPAPAAGAPAIVARLQVSPLQLTLLVDGRAVVQEAAPLSWDDSSSSMTLARDAAPLAPGLSQEYFFGGGMQNGHFSHRDATITIGVDYNWDVDGHPNSVPWFLSSAGYGVLRNTWMPGQYAFSSPVVASHNESNRLDAFFVLTGAGSANESSAKALLSLYTQLTGPPFLPPLYALGLGDSDCYHNDRHGNSSQVAIAVGELYQKFDMPRGWMLINDGCEALRPARPSVPQCPLSSPLAPTLHKQMAAATASPSTASFRAT